MKKVIIFLLAIILASPVFSQKEKLAESLLESLKYKDYKRLEPWLVPDSIIVKPPANATKKELELVIAAAAMYRLMQKNEWENWRKWGKKNKIEFAAASIKEVLFKKSAGSEGDLYIHYVVNGKQILVKLPVVAIGGNYFLEWYPINEERFVIKEPQAIEAELSVLRTQ